MHIRERMRLDFVGQENFLDAFQMDEQLIRRVHGEWHGALSILVTVSVSMKGRSPVNAKRRMQKKSRERKLIGENGKMRIEGVVCGHRLVERSLIWL